MSMGLDPLREVHGVGIDQYRAGLGEYLDQVASDAWANGPLSEVGRAIDAAQAQDAARSSGEPLLSAEEASDRGRELGLRFEAPIAEGAFNVLADEKRRQAAAESVFKRARLENGYGTLDWLLGGGAEFLTMAADPLNLASAFVPVVGEARYASWAARIGRLPATLARGAAEGAAGQALLEPLTALDRAQQGSEYGMLDTLANVAFGSGLGVVLHGAGYGAGAGFRFIRDRYSVSTRPAPAPEIAGPTGDLVPAREELSAPVVEREATPPPRQPAAEAMEQLRPETKAAAMRAAVAQLAQDKPVDLEPLLRADPAWPQVKASLEEMTRHLDLQRQATAEARPTPLAVPADFKPSPDELKLARRVARGWQPEAPIEAPLSLADFVRRAGGLGGDTPEGAEVVASDLGAKAKGLVVPPGGKGARDAEHLAQAAREAGYRVGRDTRTGSGVDIDGFVKALIEDASGARQHLPEDSHTAAYLAQQAYFDEFARTLADLGIEPRGMEPRRLAWLLAQDPHTARLASLIDRIDQLSDSASLELFDRLDREAADLQMEILRGEPGALEEDMAVDHRETPAPTLAELEQYYADVEGTAGPDATGGQAPGRGAGAGRPAEGGQAPAARPAAREPAPAPAGLRRAPGEERPAGAEPGAAADLSPPTPDELARFAERQQTADLHADPAALVGRDERLASQAREAQQLLADDLKDFGHLLDEDTRLVFDEAGKVFDDESRGIAALAACHLGGGA